MSGRSKKRLWGFEEGERSLLLASTAGLPDLHALVTRAEPHKEIPGLWIVWSTVEELDEMYSLVEELMDGTRSRRRLDVLEGMLASLCTSMDGF